MRNTIRTFTIALAIPATIALGGGTAFAEETVPNSTEATVVQDTQVPSGPSEEMMQAREQEQDIATGAAAIGVGTTIGTLTGTATGATIGAITGGIIGGVIACPAGGVVTVATVGVAAPVGAAACFTGITAGAVAGAGVGTAVMGPVGAAVGGLAGAGAGAGLIANNHAQ